MWFTCFVLIIPRFKKTDWIIPFSYSTCNWCFTCFVAQKSRDNAIPKAMGPQKDHGGRKALRPLSRNIIRKDFHSARENLNEDTDELKTGVKINTTTKKKPSVKTPANYVPVWKRPLSTGKNPGGSPSQSPQRKSVSSGNAASNGQGKCKVLRQPPMRFRL